MAQYIDGQDRSGDAGDDLSAKQFIFVEERTEHTFHQASATTAITAGIVQNKPKSGEQVRVRFMGISKVLAGGTITANALITNNASGAGVVVTSGTILKGRACGAVASGGIFEAEIYSGGLQRAFTVVDSDCV